MLSDRLDNGENFLYRRNFLIGNKNKRIVVNGNHFIGIRNHISGGVTSVKTHSVNGREFGFHRFAFLNGYNAVLADFFHRLGNKFANRFVACGNGSDLCDRVFGFNGFAYRFKFVHNHVDGFGNTFFKNDGVCARGEVFKSFAYHCLSENDSRSRSVAGNVVSFCRNFFDELRAHIFKRVFQFDFFSDRNAVVRDERSAVFFIENHVSTLRAERDFNRIRKRVYARFKRLSCIFAVFYLFSHIIIASLY